MHQNKMISLFFSEMLKNSSCDTPAQYGYKVPPGTNKLSQKGRRKRAARCRGGSSVGRSRNKEFFRGTYWSSHY